jgi:hypothetical protein
MRPSMLAVGLVIWVVLNPGWCVAQDLGIVQVVTRAAPGKPSGQFTACHIGRGILLTCGHCCRYAGGPGATVDVAILSEADRSPYRTAAGVVLCFDGSADVGLIRLESADLLTVAHALAPRDFRVAKGHSVVQYTWGAPGGRVLRSVKSTVTAVNLFVGPDNIETRFAPVQGDSGAPLVSQPDGLIIGVTTGADAWGRFGVHAGTAAIHDLALQCRIDLPMPVRP